MVSLVDIVPQKRTVQIAAGDLELEGLSLRKIADLFLRFPMLRQALTPGAPELDVEKLIISAPDAVGAVIAEAAGQPEAAESLADNMGIEDLAECLGVVLELTAPRGLSPLLERLAKLFGASLASLEGNPGRAPVTNSQRPPNSSSPPDTHAET